MSLNNILSFGNGPTHTMTEKNLHPHLRKKIAKKLKTEISPTHAESIKRHAKHRILSPKAYVFPD